MENQYNKFIKLVKANKEAEKEEDKIEKQDTKYPYYRSSGVINKTCTFYLSYFENTMWRRQEELIELDNEDIEYLVNKYSKRVQEELESKINKLKREYE